MSASLVFMGGSSGESAGLPKDAGLRLTIVERAGKPLHPRTDALFRAPGATIGRGADNHLVLADETRQISRLQAAIRIDDSGAYLSNLSTVCAVLVNERAVEADQPQRLQPGDIVSIGLYRLAVGDAEAPQPGALATPTPFEPAATVPAPAPVPPPAVDDSPLPPDSFWDQLTAEFAPSPDAATRFDPVHERQHEAPLAAPREPEPAPASDDVLAALGNASLDPLALFTPAQDDGPSALFDGSASILPAESSALAELSARHQGLPLQAGQSPLFDAAPMPIPTPATMPPIRPAASSPAQAFLEGAGISLDDPALSDAQFRQAGRLLAKLVNGSMDLLAGRTIIKREVKADLTMLLDKENNPLKLLPDAPMVLKQMFGASFPGFMAPERAIDDTFHDLQAHQMGMLAGMRAALNQLLHNFSPEMVDKQMGADVWYERLMPKGRDGRAWVRYRALHAAAVAAVEDDFHTVFGQVFLAAYDAEVELYRAQIRAQAC